jgi:hypothetical protein
MAADEDRGSKARRRVARALVSGRGLELERPPGRVMITSPKHTLAELAEAIDVALARWDHSHLHEFKLGDGRRYMLGGSDFEPEVSDSSTAACGRTSSSSAGVAVAQERPGTPRLCAARISPPERVALADRDDEPADPGPQATAGDRAVALRDLHPGGCVPR